MPSEKSRRGPHSRKSAKRKKSKRRNRVPETWSLGQTNEPFEQDTKRRIGQHVGTGTERPTSRQQRCAAGQSHDDIRAPDEKVN